MKFLIMKISIKQFVCSLPLLVSMNTVIAQSNSQKNEITKVQKFKPPIVKSYLGNNTNGDTVTKEEAAQIILLPLLITDNKKNTYQIDSYHFLYKRKGIIQDDETGKKESTFTTVADIFRTTPLSKIWIDNIKDGFQKGEEIYFFDIVVKDKSDRKFFAPDLKITIE